MTAMVENIMTVSQIASTNKNLIYMVVVVVVVVVVVQLIRRLAPETPSKYKHIHNPKPKFNDISYTLHSFGTVWLWVSFGS